MLFYAGITGSTKFPFKFCPTRWVESAKTAQRALEIFESIKLYILDPSVKLPHLTSVNNVKQGVGDPLMPAKLAFFSTVATMLEPFLTKFQSDAPLVPFLFSSIHSLITTLLEMFVEEKSIPKDIKRLLILNFKDEKIFLSPLKIHLGFSTKKFLKSAKATEAQKLSFRKECLNFLKATVMKILERSTLKYDIARGVTSLDPNLINHSPEVAISRMNIALEELYSKDVITSESAERAKLQYKNMITKTFYFREYSGEMRLDDFYFRIIGKNAEFSEIWEVIKVLLTLSHGNAYVEGGFSINKQLLIENLHEKSLIAQRIIYDNIIAAGGVLEVNITYKMIKYARESHKKYKEAMSQRTEVVKSQTNKRKILDEIKDLEEKKRRLENASKAESFEISDKINILKKNL